MESDVSLPRIEPTGSTVDIAGVTVATAETRLPGVPRGAALLLLAEDGLATQAPELMNALAEHGYEALAADLSVLGLDDAGAVAAVRTLLAVLARRGWEPDQIGVVGYDDGGAAVLAAAGELTLGAAVSLSPRGVTRGTVPMVRTPWLGLFGEHDPVATPAAVTELGRRLADAPAFSRVVVYPGVGPDYHHGAADALGHAASFDSWQRVVEWLNVRVSPRLTPYAELWELRHQQPSDPSPEGSTR